MEPPLKCSVCGSPCVRDGDDIQRTCDHTDAAVIAELEAVTYGEGGMQE